MSRHNLTGNVYGRLKVVSRAKNDKHNKTRWNCLCSCGKFVESVLGTHLVGGNIVSCGCSRITHGLSSSYPLAYKAWKAMRHRVENHDNYRDIDVCEKWQDFKNFVQEAVFPFFKGEDIPKGLTLDRIDSYKDYHPDNIRWVSRSENSKNKRNTNYLTAFNETKTLGDWAKDTRCLVDRKTLLNRLKTGKFSHEDILTKKRLQ